MHMSGLMRRPSNRPPVSSVGTPTMKFPDILSIHTGPVVSSYSDKDTLLYALGIGMGSNPLDGDELRFVYEKDLRVVPTLSAVLAKGADRIISEGRIDLSVLLHGEQRLRVHRPLPPEGRIVTGSRCLGVVDKGADKGALLNIESTIADADSGDLLASIIMTLFCRGDGGFGGPTEGGLTPHQVPLRAPDKVVALPTRPDQAAIYRLSGDRNPLHIDPDAARRAGFERPILHGLCTYGIACRAVMLAYCGLDPTLVRTFDARFAAPVFPGDTLVTRLWRDGNTVSFECGVAEREGLVLSNGRCELNDRV